MTNVKAMEPSFGKMVANISASGRPASSMASALTSAKRVSRSKVNGRTDVKSSGSVSRIVLVRPLTMDKTTMHTEIFIVRRIRSASIFA